MNALSDVPTLTVRCEIAATAEELFDAWLDPASLAIWMRPGDMQRATVKIDARVGGKFEILMHGATETYPHSGTYQELDRPRRLVFTWNSRATQQIDSLVTIEFRPLRGATEIVLTHERLPSAEAAAAHTKGWNAILELIAQNYDRLRSTG